MNANQHVPIDTLAAVVWERTPADAAHRLRMLLRSIAIQLPPGVLQVGDTVHLVLSDGAVDAERFSGLIRDGYRHWADGEYDRAGANVVEALRLWRGTPYPELVNCLPAAPEIERLTTLRVDAVVLHQEDLLRRAIDFTAVADLRYSAAGHPQHLGLRLQLARALYVTGRQIEALQVLRVATVEIGDHPTTSRLMTLILRRDPEAATLSTIGLGDRSA